MSHSPLNAVPQRAANQRHHEQPGRPTDRDCGSDKRVVVRYLDDKDAPSEHQHVEPTHRQEHAEPHHAIVAVRERLEDAVEPRGARESARHAARARREPRQWMLLGRGIFHRLRAAGSF